MKQNKPRARWGLAAVAALALTASGTLGLATVASAAEVGPDQPSAPPQVA